MCVRAKEPGCSPVCRRETEVMVTGLDDLQARLRTAVEDADRKLNFVFGAGLSNGLIPSVSDMINVFISELPKPEQKAVRSKVEVHQTDIERYQAAAQLVLARGGVKRVRAALCRATLNACTISHDELVELSNNLTVDRLRQIEQTGPWKQSRSHAKFAAFYADLPTSLRGKILTTNFDPLLELNLNAAGIPAEPIPIAGDVVPTQEQLDEQTSTPVFHLHGFWRTTNSLHTASQLERTRPTVSRLIRQTFSNSIVFVIGYGGWSDVFMSSLAEALQDGQLYDCELCWAIYSNDENSILGNPNLSGIRGIPGCNLYFGVDANLLFDLDLPATDINLAIGSNSAVVSPDGFTIIKPADDALTSPLTGHDSKFADGYEPDWQDALPGSWPILDSTTELIKEARLALQDKSGGVAAIGPIGEGKSLALRQTAIVLEREFPTWTILWREPGAPQLTAAWLESATDRFGPLCICIDNADLIIEELVSCRDVWMKSLSEIVIILASHDRIWWSAAKSIANTIPSVLFHGISREDARAIASSWSDHSLLPRSFAAMAKDDGIASTSRKLYASAAGIEGSTETTLMGAVLATRAAEGLESRVVNLLDRLHRERASRSEQITMAHIFGSICLVQDVFDPEGIKGEGISRTVLAAIVDLNGTFPDARILTILGKEALISFAGERVYSRHSSIARAVINRLRRQGEMEYVCFLVGRAAARVRNLGSVPREAWVHPYQLSKKLQYENEALKAADGVLHGVPKSLAARLDRINVLRRTRPEAALEAATTTLLHRASFNDVDECIRIYLNELSRCALQCSQPSLALGAAAIGFGGTFKYPLDLVQSSYFLKTFHDAAVLLRGQSVTEAADIAEYALALSGKILTQTQLKLIQGTHPKAQLSHLGSKSSAQLLSGLQTRLLKFAQQAAGNLQLQDYFRNSLDFSWVLQRS